MHPPCSCCKKSAGEWVKARGTCYSITAPRWAPAPTEGAQTGAWTCAVCLRMIRTLAVARHACGYDVTDESLSTL